MKKHFSTILLGAFFLAGLSLLLYPTFSNWWNSFRQSRAIVDYDHVVETMDQEEYDRILGEAKEFNRKLRVRGTMFKLSDAEMAEYNKILDVSGTGIMGTIEIPKINVEYPIYHDTRESALAIAIGHIPGTSFPVCNPDDPGTHCVLSGHRGLPSARLFTDLDKMEVGDYFRIRVLDEYATFVVDGISIVLPHEVDELDLTVGEDRCTLVTCTPYGINTHRLLIHGKWVPNEFLNEVRITSDATQVDTMLVAPIVAVPILLALIILVFVKSGRDRNRVRVYAELREEMADEFILLEEFRDEEDEE